MGPGCTGLQPETAARPALAAPSASRPERPVPRIRIGPALPDRKSLDAEIARLRDLGVSELRSRWHNVFGRRPHPHLPRHLLFRVLAYRLQADVLGDLDGESQRLLDRSVSPEDAGRRAVDLARRTADLRPGTVLGREWNGQMHRVAVSADGFAWNGKTYPSLSKVAFAITGTRWNGHRFFGLRDRLKLKSELRPCRAILATASAAPFTPATRPTRKLIRTSIRSTRSMVIPKPTSADSSRPA